MQSKNNGQYRIGVDIGGTFTDGALVDTSTGQITTSKVLSTPEDPALGFVAAIEKLIESQNQLLPETVEHVVHATTVATNAIIEGTTSTTAFITTEGFRDMLEIARQIRPSLYDLQFEKPAPMVPRQLCFEIAERLDPDGNVIVPINADAIDEVVNLIIGSKVEAVAVCLLHSYKNPCHERMIGEALRAKLKGVPVSLSSEVIPEFREYLRASTTVINASISPIVSKYLQSINEKLTRLMFKSDLLVMQSNGGVYSAEMAIKSPVFMVESGPAAGSMIAAELGSSLGYPNVISFDMGGTTAKASLILDGKPSITKDYSVGRDAKSGMGAFGGATGYPIRTPVIDLVEIGSGGGSIAWVDSGGALRVGPHSAGADPGPACYGLGGDQPTITDANLILGRLDPDYFAAGEIPLNIEKSKTAIINKCANHLGLSGDETAYGIIEIANTAMVNLLRLVSVQRGYDPREFKLIAFGGAGPAHAVRLADQAGIPEVLIPYSPGTASSLGLLVTDVRMEKSSTMIVRSDDVKPLELEHEFKKLEKDSRKSHPMSRSIMGEPIFERFVEMRYWGQSFELSVPEPKQKKIDRVWLDALISAFHEAHKIAYGFSTENEPVEIVNLRLTMVGKIPRNKMRRLTNRFYGEKDILVAKKGSRPVYFGEAGGYVESAVYNRDLLPSGGAFEGPAIVEEKDCTTVVHPNWIVNVDDYGNLLIKKV